ncbi:MAG: hypothetical protein HBSAPP03_13420 [Phycisphaerae bacterium]|nr:MAG: hypothetical protein HBSAPP03_13420 [Phycisphaerae bacterium]
MDQVEVLPLTTRVRVRIARDPAPDEAPPGTPLYDEWARLCAMNPRLHNGPILSVVTLDAEQGDILVRRETYQRLAAQPRVATGVRLFAVTAVLTARDRAGRSLVLFGRRSDGVRIYPGMWELGPSGGIGVPAASMDIMDEALLLRSLADEVEEEVGERIASGAPIAVVRDHVARSDDVVFRIDLGTIDDFARAAPANWEYTQTRWVHDVPAFLAAHGDEVIAPTRALVRALGLGTPAR